MKVRVCAVLPVVGSCSRRLCPICSVLADLRAEVTPSKGTGGLVWLQLISYTLSNSTDCGLLLMISVRKSHHRSGAGHVSRREAAKTSAPSNQYAVLHEYPECSSLIIDVVMSSHSSVRTRSALGQRSNAADQFMSMADPNYGNTYGMSIGTHIRIFIQLQLHCYAFYPCRRIHMCSAAWHVFRSTATAHRRMHSRKAALQRSSQQPRSQSKPVSRPSEPLTGKSPH